MNDNLLSNVDCFHPSEMGHRWFAKQLWRMMFLPLTEKKNELKFDQFLKIYCPTDSDRFQIK
ncbi:hypothetical protein BDA99DRAFT_530591 [Phascolomyces articulosus]|uniref:Uncharacterized protein n=1 Tax=Phascolomyces articulosus TaxID=60185 RepID=A0AAD5JVS8_9FUNG|nr:hypothetical protein BDA99DRAFT_530591 [Phascolomyces articulosus]